MPVRPAIEEQTLEKINEKVEEHMAVPPESVSIDNRINVLINALESEKRKRKMAQKRSDNQSTRY